MSLKMSFVPGGATYLCPETFLPHYVDFLRRVGKGKAALLGCDRGVHVSGYGCGFFVRLPALCLPTDEYRIVFETMHHILHGFDVVLVGN